MAIPNPQSKIQNRKSAVLLLLLGCAAPSAAPLQPGRLADIRLPAGFSIAVFSDRVPGARSLTLSPKGIVYVGTRDEGKVYAVVDRDRDGRADEVHTIASGLRSPNGVAWRDGALYVAEISRLLRFDGIDGRLANPPAPKVVYDGYPKDGHHGWKFIRFGPDGKLYVPVGAPCNICDEEKPIYASITRISLPGGKPEIFARGIRNTVGFDWHPQTGELWFTDNGRDWLGDDSPPDELDRAPRAGLHFGFPYCHAGRIADPELGRKRPCSAFVPPAINLAPHVAAIGMRFYTGGMFPPAYRGQIFIAEHGSWNRRGLAARRRRLGPAGGRRGAGGRLAPRLRRRRRRHLPHHLRRGPQVSEPRMRQLDPNYVNWIEVHILLSISDDCHQTSVGGELQWGVLVVVTRATP